MTWESVFSGSHYDEEFHNNSHFSRSNNLNYFILNCFFHELSPNGAVRISTTIDTAKTYVNTNKFESCSSVSQNGGSLFFGSQGQFVQTKNSFINSTNSCDGSSFYIYVSHIQSYKNHANETLVSNCGTSEQDCSVTTNMGHGFTIMYECNITQNRVKKWNGGYSINSIASDSYITCVNVIENNQSVNQINYHSSISLTFKVTSCNYIRNKSSNNGDLISSFYSNIFMSYCFIRENKVPYIFYASLSTITFENSTTDNSDAYSDNTASPPIFKNTDISFENKCPLLIIPTTNNDQPIIPIKEKSQTAEIKRVMRIIRRR